MSPDIVSYMNCRLARYAWSANQSGSPALLGEAPRNVGHRPFVPRVDEQRVDHGGKLVSGRPRDRPLTGQSFVGAEDLLDDDVQRGTAGVAASALETLEVCGRIVQA